MSTPTKTTYEYLVFEQVKVEGFNKTKTTPWTCMNLKSRGELGMVKWHGAWRQYCYFPTVQAVYSSGCLSDIADFLNQLNKK